MTGNVSERIRIIQGDITLQRVDVIVNAANSSLLGGGEVGRRNPSRAGGRNSSNIVARLEVVQLARPGFHRGFRLPAKWVIHTVGPVWQGEGVDEDRLLARCYRNSLLLTAERGLQTIAFPQISTEVYGFPMHRAALIAIAEIGVFLSRPCCIKEVRCVVFSEASRAAANGLTETPSALSWSNWSAPVGGKSIWPSLQLISCDPHTSRMP